MDHYVALFFKLDDYVRSYYADVERNDGFSFYKDEGRDLFHPDDAAYILDMLSGDDIAVTIGDEKGEGLGSFVILKIRYEYTNGKKDWFYLATSILPKSTLIYQTAFHVLRAKFPSEEISPVFTPQGSLKSLSVIIPPEDRNFYGFVVGENLKNLEYSTIFLRCPFCKKEKPVEEFVVAKLEYPDTEKFIGKMKINKIIGEVSPSYYIYELSIAFCSECKKKIGV